MTDLDLLRRITRDLWYWQGLRWAPMGLVGLASAATFSPAWPAGIPEEGILIAAIAVGFVLYALASRYYDRTMGHVAPDLTLTEGRSAVKWFAVYPAMGIALVLDALLVPPIFLTGIVWAVALLLYWWSTGQGREHYLVIVGATATLTFMPLLDPALAGKGGFPIFFAWMGIVYFAAGILDHMALMRALPQRSGS